ncbi:MAG: cupredoxin domain-containing protein [Chloroflexota bacterium]|nr:cupredoxin domain-containing protein [Chloroflexota bacterium]
MSSKGDTGRVQRHRSLEEGDRGARWRYAAGAAIAVVVLGAGMFLAFGDFLGRPDADTTSATPVRMSMAGFDPQIITAKAGSDIELELWTTDGAIHLEGGVHTVISDELGIYEELAAESRRTVTLRMPTAPGDYDIYCDTCCGGKDSPTMHGKLRVVA